MSLWLGAMLCVAAVALAAIVAFGAVLVLVARLDRDDDGD